ncbi:hypothetical protein AB6A40_002801 [Gnathostoma spinigerum]|uniref:Alkaline ceramidase n=1 Tax=Gnathostoma spinigerum TaxID=75299 RepID=A0ABD6E9X3_9BILA
MGRWFEYESGVAWCESAFKYQTLPIVAEFANTVTNLPIIVLPLINVFMLRKYISANNRIVLLPHLMLTINGVASTYYHATLNLFGQIVDELSILWLINVCLVAYLPIMNFYPDKLKSKVIQLRRAIICLTAVISAFCFVEPHINAFVLMAWSIPGLALIYFEAANSGISEVVELRSKIITLWLIAVIFWFSDRLMCDLWLFFGIPYFHAIFHLLSSFAAYQAFIMFSLLDIHRNPSKYFTARINYFPKRGLFAFPYIAVTEEDNSSKL